MENSDRQNKIRVMHLVACWPNKIYGGEAAALALARKADKDRFYSVIACLKDPRAVTLPLMDKAISLGIPAETVYLKWRFDPLAAFRLKKLLHKYNIAVLHCHGYKADVVGFLASRLIKVRLVSTCHGWWPNTPKLKFYNFIDMTVLRFFDAVVAVSPQILSALANRKIYPSKLDVIQNGIDVTSFSAATYREKIKKDLGIKEGDIVVGSVGRLTGEKGINYLLEAASKIKIKIPNAVFVIVGEGTMKDYLVDYARKLDVSDKVLFAGYREDIDKILSALDIFVMPSLTEGLPLALLEAMAAGKPVIASNVGGIPMIIDNGKTGILVKPKNPDQIERAISSLIGDKRYSDTIAENGRKFVENNFSLAVTAKKYEELYSKLLKETK